VGLLTGRYISISSAILSCKAFGSSIATICDQAKEVVYDAVDGGDVRTSMTALGVHDPEWKTLEGPTCAYRKLDSAILVMKTTKDGRRCNNAAALDRPRERSILVKREMTSRFVIIGDKLAKDPTQMHRPKYHHVVETFPSDRADQSLHVPILPWLTDPPPCCGSVIGIRPFTAFRLMDAGLLYA
jgi:hypothetical protein